MKKGIDLSHHNTVTDWNKVKRAVDFVILRSSYGKTGTDRKFNDFVYNARNANIPIVGTYHFSYALSVQDAVLEADRAVEKARTNALTDVIIFYDHEKDSENYYKKQTGKNISDALIASMCKAFCDRVISKGYKTGIYFNKSQYKRFAADVIKRNPSYYEWLADYNKTPAFKASYVQTTSNGVIDGISGHVDLDTCYIETYPELDKGMIITHLGNTLIGKYGNGEYRKAELGVYYKPVQELVNKIYSEVNKL